MSYFTDPLLQIVLSLVGFGVFWSAVVFLISRVSGWATVAKRFPYTKGTYGVGEKRYFKFVRFGISNYQGLVHFESLSQGLHIFITWPFKPGHKDMLVPWNELSEGSLVWPTYKFTFLSIQHKYFLVWKGVANWIMEEKKKYTP